MIGRVIDDSYRIEKHLGEGSFGEVYEVTDLELNRKAAMKVLRLGLHGDKELKQFQDEGRNLASLNHPNVVQVYRLGSFEKTPYIVMEYVQGDTLRQLEQQKRLSVRQTVEIMAQVAAGLGAIHAMGVLHRDLSPNNVMVAKDGRAKILDFGLSRATGGVSMQSRSYLAGTLYYAAPEQINGTSTGTRAEVFAFGVMLYEALAGVHPFASEHHMSVLYNIAHREAEPLSSHVEDCPPELKAIVERCMQKSPDDRPARIDDVASALSEILREPGLESSAARRIEAATAAPRQTSRNPYLNRNMIKRREDFFGRAAEVKRIYARLNADPPGSVSVVGDRKIGKSSVLNHIYAKANREKFLEQPDKMVMVFLDFQQEKDMSIASFVRTLLGIASYELRGRVEVDDIEHTLDGVKDLVQRLDSAGFRMAILLDEFDTVTTNPNFSLEFFSFLRYLANHYNVAYVTSSSRNLQVLCHTKEISDSPFFNIFTNMRLSVFRKPEALELITVPSKKAGKPLETHAESIMEMAGLFPFFIQMACSHALEYLDENPETQSPDFDEVRRRFYEEAKLHYRYVWDSFDEHERSTVLRVAKGKSMPDELRHIMAELESRSYVQSSGDKPELFSSTFDDFVKTERGSGGEKKGGFLGKLFGRK